jgi:Sigma-70, region 4
MSPLDELSPDQHAVLSLLLRQRRSYAEVARLLSIPQEAVRDRALLALKDLSGAPEGIDPSRRIAIGEYLIGAQSAAERSQTLRYLQACPSAIGWAEDLRRQLQPLAADPLPQIPSASSADAPSEETQTLLEPPSSKLAGGLLLIALIAVVVVAVVLIVNGGHSSKSSSASRPSVSASSSSSSTANSKLHLAKQLNLKSPDPTSKAVGVVEVLSESGRLAFYLAAEGLAPSHGFFYAAWLEDARGQTLALGKGPRVGSNGRLQALGALPANASNFHELLITKERSDRPAHPGQIVLSGPFSLR